MKVVINKCFGGFGLSKKAVKRLAELQGRPCYFFVNARKADGHVDFGRYAPDDGSESLFWYAFDIPDPDKLRSPDNWHEMPLEERKGFNSSWDAHSLDKRPDNRSDPLLIQVVEELGDEASGALSKLKVVEIPDGTEYEIDEYDGQESIHEVHRAWG